MRLEHLDEVIRVTCSLMADFAAPWCVAGGWAIDLFLGHVTRPHADLELAVFRQDQFLLHRHLQSWTFKKVAEGQRKIWRSDEQLVLPVHELHARSVEDPSHTIEFLLNEGDDYNWIFRRNLAISLPLNRAICRTKKDVPILSPEIVLLFKAKSPRMKDESDFEFAFAEIEKPRQQWLRSALHACHPNHPWLESLNKAISSGA